MKKCLIVCGPTASGKTALGIQLAEKYKTSIISADSRQCYRELNIGVAKPSAEELRRVEHYFIDTYSIHEEVTVKDFEEFALQKAMELFQSHDQIIMVGGTGLYIKAFAEGLDEIPEPHTDLRQILEMKFKVNGFEWLQQEVRLLDPLFAEKGEMENPRRMLRALEVILTTGKSIVDYQSKKAKTRPFEVEYIFLNPPRQNLYRFINSRTEKMIRDGLLKEAEALFPYRHLTALQTVGYREIFDYMEGRFSFREAVEEIKKNTRRYAKRQVTWFKKYAVPPGGAK